MTGTIGRYRLAAAIIAMAASWSVGLAVVKWRAMEGWEAYAIAQAVAAGEGYSFPSSERWLFERTDDGEFHATAWVDPLYTYALAALISIFGDYHKLAAALLNYFLFLGAFALTYRLAERLVSPRAGVIAVLLLGVSRFSTMPSYMYNTLLAAAFILLTALAMIRFFEAPSRARAALLGVVLALTALACPSAQYFLPITVVSIAVCSLKHWRSGVVHALIVLVSAAAVMSPWVIRNYAVFGEVVSVRNGGGQIAFIGSVAAAATVDPDAVRSTTKPSWTAETPIRAVFTIYQDERKKEALVPFQLQYAAQAGPDDWAGMNEAQRDQWFLDETKAFMLANPWLSIELMAAKAIVFIGVMGLLGAGVIFLALAGSILTVTRPALATLSLCVASYAGPFLLVIAYFIRYRAPIEPLLTLLAVIALFWAIDRVTRGRSQAQ